MAMEVFKFWIFSKFCTSGLKREDVLFSEKALNTIWIVVEPL